MATCAQSIDKVIKLYKAHVFTPRMAFADPEFTPMKFDLAERGVILNSAAAGEHVPKIEREIRTIKEHVRCTHHTLPFKYIPAIVLVHLVYTSVLWLNAFPCKGRASDVTSPRQVITGMQFDFDKHC